MTNTLPMNTLPDLSEQERTLRIMKVNPWLRLAEDWPQMPVTFLDLGSIHRHGVTRWYEGQPVALMLHYQLTQVQRRCTLAHELEHLDRGAPCDTLKASIERRVITATAKYLLPDLDMLADMMAHIQRRKGKRRRHLPGAVRRPGRARAVAQLQAEGRRGGLRDVGAARDPLGRLRRPARGRADRAGLPRGVAGAAGASPAEDRGVTQTRFRTMVYPHIGDLPIGSVRPSTIRTVAGDLLAAGYAASTVKGVRGQVAGAFDDAIRDRLLTSSPFDGVKAPEVVREEIMPLTVAQVRAGEAAMPDRYRALITLIAGTGLRAAEAWGLTRDRLDLERRRCG
jgi:hypothetical protein